MALLSITASTLRTRGAYSKREESSNPDLPEPAIQSLLDRESKAAWQRIRDDGAQQWKVSWRKSWAQSPQLIVPGL
jgi:hypothetical protein